MNCLAYCAAFALTLAMSNAGAGTCPAALGPTPTPTSDFIINADGTVLHTNTGLMWKRCVEGLSGSSCQTGGRIYKKWEDALILAKNSNFAGYSDWRLPSWAEAKSLVDPTCYAPAMNEFVFPGPTPDSYQQIWTSTTNSNNSVWTRTVSLYDGNTSTVGVKGYSVNQLRLVRSGQSFDSLAPRLCRLDVDGDGKFLFAVDGLLLIRYLLNISGASLVSGIASFSPLAARKSSNDLSDFMTSLDLDIDGSGGPPSAQTDGMIVLRAMLGLTGAAVTAGLPIPSSAARRDWTTLAPYLRDACLMPVTQ